MTGSFALVIPTGVVWPVAFVAGAAAGAVLWIATRDTFEQPLFARRNYRGIDVPVGAGVLIAAATFGLSAFWLTFDTLGRTSSEGADIAASLVVVCLLSGGFSLLGLFDDLAAKGDDRGFSGHVRALLQGRLTTGGLKLLVGGLLALAVSAGTTGAGGFWRVVLGGAVLALAANLGNLFDRAPGRCSKVALLCGAVLLVCAGSPDRPLLTGVLVVLGAAAGLGWFDLREQLMLGDAGANVLGAVLGWGVVVTTAWTTQVVVLVVLIALNALSEKVSFSSVIASTPPLRAIDRLGRRSSTD